MIYLVVALAAEARPLIHHFQLEAVDEVAAWPIYQRSDVGLIVAGVGKHSVRAAIDGLVQALPAGARSVWLNIGVAGHRNHAIGTAALARRVFDEETGAAFDLTPPAHVHLETADVRTVTHVETRYDTEAFYEMEAAAFCERAADLTSPELIQVLKVVSDNRRSGTLCVSARQVQGLIEESLPPIDRLVSGLHRLARRLDQ